MEAGKKRRLTYVITAIAASAIVILAVILLQQPIPASTVPKNPNNGGGGGNNPPPSTVTPPGITTIGAAGVGQSNATLQGDLTALGTATSVAVGFQFGPSPTLATMTNVTAVSAASLGELRFNASGLDANSTYYFRAWALGDGFVTGTTLSFTTLAKPVTPPGGGGSGNGHHIPPGWAHAACPDIPTHAKAHGVNARCLDQETYGQKKKEASAGAVGNVAEAPLTPLEKVRANAASRNADPGNSGSHRSANARSWG